MKFIRKTRDVIEAEQYFGVGFLIVKTPSGEVKAEPGDYIVDRGGGDRYPVKPTTFEAIYEPLVEDVAEAVNTEETAVQKAEREIREALDKK